MTWEMNLYVPEINAGRSLREGESSILFPGNIEISDFFLGGKKRRARVLSLVSAHSLSLSFSGFLSISFLSSSFS